MIQNATTQTKATLLSKATEPKIEKNSDPTEIPMPTDFFETSNRPLMNITLIHNENATIGANDISISLNETSTTHATMMYGTAGVNGTINIKDETVKTNLRSDNKTAQD